MKVGLFHKKLLEKLANPKNTICVIKTGNIHASHYSEAEMLDEYAAQCRLNFILTRLTL